MGVVETAIITVAAAAAAGGGMAYVLSRIVKGSKNKTDVSLSLDEAPAPVQQERATDAHFTRSVKSLTSQIKNSVGSGALYSQKASEASIARHANPQAEVENQPDKVGRPRKSTRPYYRRKATTATAQYRAYIKALAEWRARDNFKIEPPPPRSIHPLSAEGKIYDAFLKKPYHKYSFQELKDKFESEKMKAGTISSTLFRLSFTGKISRHGRGKYMKNPIDPQSSHLYEVI